MNNLQTHISSYLEYKNIILQNPFNKIQIHFRKPVILPKTIPLYIVEEFLFTIYKQRSATKTNYQKEMPYAMLLLLSCYSPQEYESQNFAILKSVM